MGFIIITIIMIIINVDIMLYIELYAVFILLLYYYV